MRLSDDETILLFGFHRDEVPGSLLHLLDLPHQLSEVLFSVHKIDLARIDHQQGRLVVVEEVVVVSFRQCLEVFQIHIPLVRVISRFDPVMQDLGLCLKKDDEVRRGDLSMEKAIDLVIEG